MLIIKIETKIKGKFLILYKSNNFINNLKFSWGLKLYIEYNKLIKLKFNLIIFKLFSILGNENID